MGKEVTYALGLSGERGTSSTTIHGLAWPSATKMFIMVEPTRNNENPTQEYIGTNNL